MNIGEECELYDMICTGCGECEVCDIDANKICDSCGKCLDIKDDEVIKIDKIIMNEDEK